MFALSSTPWHPDFMSNQGQEIDKIAEDDNQPATKGDIRQAVDHLRSDLITEIEGTEIHLTAKIDKLDAKVSSLDTKVGKLEQGQDAIFQVVKSIDEKLKDSKDLPERVERLEEAVYLSR